MAWTRDTVRTELLRLFQEHAEPGVAVVGSSQLVADLGIDSLGVMEVIAAIEDRFRLKIPDDALREVDTVDDVARAIEAKLSAEGKLEG